MLIKKIKIIDLEYCKGLSKYSDDDIKIHVKCDLNEWKLRYLKDIILSDYGWSFNRSIYKQAMKRCKNKINK